MRRYIRTEVLLKNTALTPPPPPPLSPFDPSDTVPPPGRPPYRPLWSWGRAIDGYTPSPPFSGVSFRRIPFVSPIDDSSSSSPSSSSSSSSVAGRRRRVSQPSAGDAIAAHHDVESTVPAHDGPIVVAVRMVQVSNVYIICSFAAIGKPLLRLRRLFRSKLVRCLDVASPW